MLVPNMLLCLDLICVQNTAEFTAWQKKVFGVNRRTHTKQTMTCLLRTTMLNSLP